MTDQARNLNRRAFLGGTAAISTAAAVVTATPTAAETKDLSGKSILVTGCSSGFGRLGALHYARAGATVIASMRNLDGGKRPEAVSLAAEAKAEKLKLTIIEIDVTSDAQVSQGVAEAERIAGGALDVIINNAGISVAGPIELSDSEAARLMFETNVFGPLRMARAGLPKMRARKRGLIINVTSQLGRLVVPNYGLYSPTKFALEALSEQLAYELAPHGVEVNVIQPGGYPTDIWKKSAGVTRALLARTDAERKTAYAALDATAERGNPGLSTDPMDVPRAIAEIIAMPPGKRPLRRAVHPTFRPQEPINEASAKVQRELLGRTPFGPWVKAVQD